MSAILQTENLKMIYHVGKVDVNALRGVNLAVEKGEFISIMGHSGSGKSTMLHILGGLLKPTSGKVIVDGEDLAAVSDASAPTFGGAKSVSFFNGSIYFRL